MREGVGGVGRKGVGEDGGRKGKKERKESDIIIF